MALCALGASSAAVACAGPEPSHPLKPASEWVIESPPDLKRPPFTFAPADDTFLEEVQKASFGFLWKACDPTTGMVRDRTSVDFVSVAGVGFQLAALPIAAERGWVTRDQARDRALTILRALEAEPTNRKAGLFYHFLEGANAKPRDMDVVSTIDSAIFFAGALAAGSAFDGEVRAIADRLYADADWTFFILKNPPKAEPVNAGLISLGWKPTDHSKPQGDGNLLPYVWIDAGDEQRLVTLLAVSAPNPKHRVDPALYYRLRRQLGAYAESGVLQWFPYSGALFTNFFAQTFINYAAMGPDNPAAQGAERRPRIDWWENARRAVQLHRIKATEAGAQTGSAKTPTLGANAWGLSACDGPNTYLVPGVFPNRIPTQGEVLDQDYTAFTAKDDLGGGYIAPYAAGCAVMFDPAAALSALRYYRSLKTGTGEPLVWREPGADWSGGYGFQDSFNLGSGWVAPDCVAIDQGPLVLSIENARTGLVWKLFHAQPAVREGFARLGLKP